jgi:hypothetical protein
VWAALQGFTLRDWSHATRGDARQWSSPRFFFCPYDIALKPPAVDLRETIFGALVSSH